jgi:hypothetical protein
VQKIYVDMLTLGNTVTTVKSTVNDTANNVNFVKTVMLSIPATLSVLANNINSFKTITINGSQYNLAGFPDTSTIVNPKLPDTSQFPDVDSFLSNFKDIPDVNKIANDALQSYKNITSNLPDMLNSTASQFSQMNLSSALTGNNLNQTVQSMVNIIQEFKKQLDTNGQMIKSLDSSRHTGYVIGNTLLIFAAFLCILGIVLRKYKFMTWYVKYLF